MINIHTTSKNLIDAVTSIMTEKKSVKEVEQPRAKGEKDFKDLHSYVIKEKLDPKADASVWIDDFIKSDAPQFKGKSKEERIQMALGAYYGARKDAGLEEDSIKLPEGVADFIGAASKAAADGKKEFEFGGKTYPVKISKDVANKVSKAMGESTELDEGWGPKNPKKVGTAKDNRGNKVDVELDANNAVWLKSGSNYIPSGWRLKDIQGKDTLYIDMGQNWAVTGLNKVLKDL